MLNLLNKITRTTAIPLSAVAMTLMANVCGATQGDKQQNLTFRCEQLLRDSLKQANPVVATLPNGTTAPPTNYSGGYYGTHQTPPNIALSNGLAGHGDDWDLLRHARGNVSSAFRGTTSTVSDPIRETGAAYWAGDGGWVYEIRNVPTWDLNRLLEGRVQRIDGYSDNPFIGENEFAVPRIVPPHKIRRWGLVQRSQSGILFVKEWFINPNFDGTSTVLSP